MTILTSFEHLKPIKTDRKCLVVSGSLDIMSGSRLEWLLPVTCYLLITCYLLPVTCDLLPVTCYLSPVTCYRIFFPGFFSVILFPRFQIIELSRVSFPSSNPEKKSNAMKSCWKKIPDINYTKLAIYRPLARQPKNLLCEFNRYWPMDSNRAVAGTI